MNLGSTHKNINFLSITVFLSVLVGAYYVDFTIANISMTLISFYILNIIGNWMMLHRYYSHKSFEFKSDLVRKVLTALCILAGRGSPLGWVYIHRQHHAYSDTDKDPHSPKYLKYKLFGFGHYEKMESEKMKLFLVKDLMTPEQLFIHKYYMLFIVLFVLLVGVFSVELLYFIWIVPAFLIHLSQNNFNYFGHITGYRNIETKDDSKNNIWLFPFILGEAWHNNHHGMPANHTTKIKKYEFDPIASFIKLIGITK